MEPKYFTIIIAIVTSVTAALIAIFAGVRAKRRREEFPYEGNAEGRYAERRYESRHRQSRSDSYPQGKETFPGVRPAQSSRVGLVAVSVGLVLLGVLGVLFFLLAK
ncbi:hypothetical protein JXM67_11370 [candidate division WOR-3 bacterium]|nr:hypothetical protein [candidate division WOR-3 bacterium]